MINLILLPFAASQWFRFYSFQELMGLSNVKSRGYLLLFYAYLELKSIYCSTSFCRKKDNQLDRKKEMETMNEENGMIFCMLYF